MELVIEHGNAAHGAEEVHYVDNEGRQNADFEGTSDGEPAAKEGGDGDGDGHHGCEHRAQSGGDNIGGHAGFAVPGVDIVEGGVNFLFASEGLDHAGAGDVLLHHGVESAEVVLDGAEGGAAAAGYLAGDNQHERHEDSHGQGELPVEKKHGDEGAAKKENV